MPSQRKRRNDVEPTDSSPVTTSASDNQNQVEGVDTESRPSTDAIAQRAYELYEQRGAGHGEDWNDWFQAERELTVRRNGNGSSAD